MSSALVRSVIVAATAVLAELPQADAWGRLKTALVRADAVMIELEAGRTAQGGYVASNDLEIVIWTDGREVQLPRAQVVRVVKLIRTYRHGPLIGAAIGGAIAGALVASEGDLTPGGRVLFTSVGIAVGGAIGSRADRYRNREVVYVRP
jgi:hypothetical protein